MLEIINPVDIGNLGFWAKIHGEISVNAWLNSIFPYLMGPLDLTF